MKKLINLSVAVLITAVVFGQDTIPPPKNNLDTIPNVNMNKNDTSSLSQTNKWPDTSRNRMDTVPSMREQSNANSQADSTAQSKKMISDRVIMKDDQVLVVKNGDSTLLKDSITLESGAVVTKEGAVKYTSGKTAQLKNGQYITLSNPVDNDSAADSTATTTSTTTTTTNTPAAASQPNDDKVLMKDDKVFVVKNGDSTVLADSITLASGTVVKSDATVIFKDGSTTKLQNGQMIALNPPAAPEKKPDAADTTAATPPPAAAATTPETKEKVEDKVVMKNDKVIVVRNGDSTILADSIKLGSGAVVKADATVRFKDGTTTVLKNGQFIALNPPPAEGKKTKKATTKKKG